MTKSNKIDKLAALTSDDMGQSPEETVLPESLFPPMVRRAVENPTAPAPQQPTLGQPARKATDPAPQMPRMVKPILEGRRTSPNPVESGHGAPELSDDIRAMLIMTGLRATWSMNFWRVYLPEAASIVAHVGGDNRKRWQTGVSATATGEVWMAELNRFWKDIHPGEVLPFGL